MNGSTNRAFFDELEKIAELSKKELKAKLRAEKRTEKFKKNISVSERHPYLSGIPMTGAGFHKGVAAEKGRLKKAPWSVRHPNIHPALFGLGGAAIGAGLGAAIDPQAASAGAVVGSLAGTFGGRAYGIHKGKKYLKSIESKKAKKPDSTFAERHPMLAPLGGWAALGENAGRMSVHKDKIKGVPATTPLWKQKQFLANARAGRPLSTKLEKISRYVAVPDNQYSDKWDSWYNEHKKTGLGALPRRKAGFFKSVGRKLGVSPSYDKELASYTDKENKFLSKNPEPIRVPVGAGKQEINKALSARRRISSMVRKHDTTDYKTNKDYASAEKKIWGAYDKLPLRIQDAVGQPLD